jgi:Gram-negative porin
MTITTRFALPILSAALALPALAGTSSSGKAPAQPITAAPAAPEKASVFGSTFFDDLKAQKDAAGIPITLGAWHWFRFGNEGPGTNGYGIPGLRDTYYWSIDLDPKLKLDGPTVQEIGLHAQIRLRENGLFRSYFDEQVWPWEAYAYAKTSAGTFKAGQIWKRFGLDWDGCFYGNVAYFDGFKLDPDLGASWEHTLKVSDSFKIDTIAQFFIQEDGVSGSLAGADAESSGLFDEKNTGVLRVVPTWTLDDGSSIALGLSGMVGQVDSDVKGIGDHTASAWAADLTYTNGDFKLFGEVMQNHGAVNPTRYVSGGASDEITDYLVGASYQTGPVTWRINYSAGFDKDPGGEQHLFLPGVTVALTPNIDLYVEYVKWTVEPDSGSKADYEDGFQLILNWRF